METAIIIIIVAVVSFFVGRYYYKELTSNRPGCGGCKGSCSDKTDTLPDEANGINHEPRE